MTAVKDVQKDSLKSAVEHRIVHGALPDIPDWLNNAERMMAEFEAIRWGNMAVGSGLVGEVITNETILDRLPAGTTDEERLLARKTLEYSGVTTRYRSPPLSETRDLHAVMDDTGRITAHLLDRLIKAYGRKPDHIIVTSLSLPPDVNDFIKGYANLESATDSSVRTACSGGLIAEAIAMTNPEFQDKTVAILCVEPTGYLEQKEHYTKEHIAMPGIFTDAYSGKIFTPGDYNLNHLSIQVQRGGGIDIRTDYENTLIDEGIPDFLKPYITIREGDEDLMVFNRHGVFLRTKHPDNGMRTYMNQKRTLSDFGNLTPPFIDAFVREGGIDLTQAVLYGHMPSSAVITSINNRLVKRFGFRAEQLLPFDLPAMQTGNGTSATAYQHEHYVINTQHPDPQRPQIGFAQGIGLSLVGIHTSLKTA